MQAITIDLNPQKRYSKEPEAEVDIKFSLKPFIDFIEGKIDGKNSSKQQFYRYLLQQFHQYTELDQPIPPENAGKYADLFELIYAAVSPILNDESEQLWALSQPISPFIYFGTDAFYSVLVESGTCDLKPHLKMPSASEMKESMMLNFYDLILKKYYNVTLKTELFTIKSIIDPTTNLLKYYRLNVDSRFLDITTTFDITAVNPFQIREIINSDHNALVKLQELLPPENFSIYGMSVITMVDVTPEYALDAVKNVIVEHNQCSVGCHGDNISTALKTLAGNDKIEFGLLPYIQLNNRMVMHDHSGFQSILLQAAKKDNIDFQSLMDEYIRHPRKLVFTELTENAQQHFPLLKVLKKDGVESYAVLPLYYNGALVGCLELYSKFKDVLTSQLLLKIDSATLLLSQLFQNIIIEFNYEIISVITGKFTSIQPAVQWRFFEAAYRYITSGAQERNLPVESIDFKDVHPFYGAVDIRNSSIERNLVIRKDLYLHFEVLGKTLDQIKSNISIDVQDEIPEHAAIWGYKEFEELSDREILKIEDYLLRQLPLYLTTLKNSHPEVAEIIEEYLKYTASNGPIYENRNKYEKSMRKINRAVSIKLEEFNEEIQLIYPCYFEKFRTDGVEFDIYLGQSIAPLIPMPENLLHVFRLKQLELLANITKTTHLLLPEMSLKLETTQLIFVYEKLIDISFRADEQRFDVEGGYNIRYQMVKKRIDKAHVKNSHERLTQTGKIAIVYFNSWEAQEYIGYIKELQKKKILEDEIEYIEIEELQGVQGLKALRVKVNLFESQDDIIKIA
jgi:hypothetical protein